MKEEKKLFLQAWKSLFVRREEKRGKD